MIKDGADGWLVEPEDPEQLTATLKQVLDNPREARKRVASAQQRAIDLRSMPQGMSRGAIESPMSRLYSFRCSAKTWRVTCSLQRVLPKNGQAGRRAADCYL